LSLSQNPVGFGKGFGKNGQKPVFSSKSKVAFLKAEALGKPLLTSKYSPIRGSGNSNIKRFFIIVK
jgi:hypothetical protein